MFAPNMAHLNLLTANRMNDCLNFFKPGNQSFSRSLFVFQLSLVYRLQKSIFWFCITLSFFIVRNNSISVLSLSSRSSNAVCAWFWLHSSFLSWSKALLAYPILHFLYYTWSKWSVKPRYVTGGKARVNLICSKYISVYSAMQKVRTKWKKINKNFEGKFVT